MRDQRREKRLAASGEVHLRPENDAGEFTARLMDVSASGFRAAHGRAALQTGVELSFRHPEGTGRARVVWTRILPDHVESGFVVV